MMKKLRDIDFTVSLFIVISEITRACELACRHCRAAAIDWRDPRELTTEEGLDLIDQVHIEFNLKTTLFTSAIKNAIIITR